MTIKTGRPPALHLGNLTREYTEQLSRRSPILYQALHQDCLSWEERLILAIANFIRYNGIVREMIQEL